MMPPYLEVINNAAVPISHVLYNVNGVLHADPYHIYNKYLLSIQSEMLDLYMSTLCCILFTSSMNHSLLHTTVPWRIPCRAARPLPIMIRQEVQKNALARLEFEHAYGQQGRERRSPRCERQAADSCPARSARPSMSRAGMHAFEGCKGAGHVGKHAFKRERGAPKRQRPCKGYVRGGCVDRVESCQTSYV